MSAQDARIADALRTGIDTALDGIEAVAGDTAGPVIAGLRPHLDAAIGKGIKATLDALGLETGHVVITGAGGVVVGFRVLGNEEG